MKNAAVIAADLQGGPASTHLEALEQSILAKQPLLDSRCGDDQLPKGSAPPHYSLAEAEWAQVLAKTGRVGMSKLIRNVGFCLVGKVLDERHVREPHLTVCLGQIHSVVNVAKTNDL